MPERLIRVVVRLTATLMLCLPACGDNASPKLDGSQTADAGPAADTSSTSETGAIIDAGAASDTGAASDSVATSDTGATSDTVGTGSDTGVIADMGVIADAAVTSDTSSISDVGAAGDTSAGVDQAGISDTSATSDTSAATDTGGGADSTPPDSSVDAPGTCMAWEITYDLTGSEFEISDTFLGAGDQVNVVAQPYTADDHVGPGTITLRFQDLGGAPGGLAAIYSYDVVTNFVVDSGATKVTTTLTGEAGPTACGITTGQLSGTTVAWNPSALVDHHSQGQILCTGGLCFLGGLPNGTPVPVDENTDQPLSAFVFSGTLKAFTMAQTVIQKDSTSTTSWMYKGTETNRKLVAAPACMCP